jgi:hypothetical protein
MSNDSHTSKLSDTFTSKSSSSESYLSKSLSSESYLSKSLSSESYLSKSLSSESYLSKSLSSESSQEQTDNTNLSCQRSSQSDDIKLLISPEATKINKMSHNTIHGTLHFKSSFQMTTLDGRKLSVSNKNNNFMKYRMSYDVIDKKGKHNIVNPFNIIFCDNESNGLETICKFEPINSIYLSDKKNSRYYVMYKPTEQYYLKYNQPNINSNTVDILSFYKIFKSYVLIKRSRKDNNFIFITDTSKVLKPINQDNIYEQMLNKKISMLYIVKKIGRAGNLYIDVLGNC